MATGHRPACIKSLARWHPWQGKERSNLKTRTVSWSSAVVAALVAGVLTIAFFYLAGPALGGRTGLFAPLLTSRLGFGVSPTVAVAVGLLALLAIAAVWGLIYAPVRTNVPGPDWAVGLGYGLAIWLVGRYVLMPILGIPATTGSLATSLVENLVFGLALGLLTARIAFKS